MIVVIFRTCERDDYITRLAYESYKLAGVGDKFVFLCHNNHRFKYINGLDALYIEHEAIANFGGQNGANAIIKAFKSISDVLESDVVFVSDSDIIMLKTPMDYLNAIEWDHSGFMGTYPGHSFLHSSGQCQILKGRIFNALRAQEKPYVDSVWQGEMLPQKINVADDTYISWETEKMKIKKVPIEGYWVHHKYHHLFDTFGENYQDAVQHVLRERKAI